jgi:hypothetical protein
MSVGRVTPTEPGVQKALDKSPRVGRGPGSRITGNMEIGKDRIQVGHFRRIRVEISALILCLTFL